MKSFILLCVLLGIGAAPGVILAEDREDELMTRQVASVDAAEIPLDCRAVICIRKSAGDPALTGLLYSAVGWALDATDDSSRSVTITAQAGTLAFDGSFTPDESAALTVLSERTGKGACDWLATDVQKKVYKLVHTVKKNDVVDSAGTLYGYFDFTYCDRMATQDEIEKALLLPLSHSVNVTSDATNPLQPIDYVQPGAGIETDANLSQDAQATTEISFSGHGRFTFELRVSGGTLAVAVDGGAPEVIAIPVAVWAPCVLVFDDVGEHTVEFAYAAAGDGTTAAVRNVLWLEDEKIVAAGGSMDNVRTDLRDGVRTAWQSDEILPFAYSSTNWIGKAGAAASSVARVTVVRLTGTDPDVSSWTEEVPGTFRKLYDKPGEGAVKWRPKKGVWKATFDIFNGDTSIHGEDAIFDLRTTRFPGFAVMLY